MKKSYTFRENVLILSLVFLCIKCNSIFEKLYLKCPRDNIRHHLEYIFQDQFELSDPPPLSEFENRSYLLVSAIITFRHGERSPGKGSNLRSFAKINCQKFQVLTPIGAKRLAILGQILFRRYKNLLDSNSLFITSAKNRCLQSLLNFLQGFRDMRLDRMTRQQLVDAVETDSFFRDNNFKLLHDCNESGKQFLEVAGKNYGRVSDKRQQHAPDASEDQDDLGGEDAAKQAKAEKPTTIWFESFEDPLKKFTREIFEKRRNPKISLFRPKRKKSIRRDKEEKSKEGAKLEEKPFYMRILDSIIEQIFFSKFNVFLKAGKSFFSDDKSLSLQESSYSQLCTNYAMTLNKDMWRFHKGEQKDIKFCFYNHHESNAKADQSDSFFFQKGIFVAEKGALPLPLIPEMFHGRTRLNYEKESAAAVDKIEEIVWRAFHSFGRVTLLKLFFKFCVACKGFDTPWNVLKNLKTIFTNIYCTISNRIHRQDYPAKELEILGIAFRGFYSKIQYPTTEVVKYQVGVYFKTAGLQFLLQVLRFHRGISDSTTIRIFDKVASIGHVQANGPPLRSLFRD